MAVKVAENEGVIFAREEGRVKVLGAGIFGADRRDVQVDDRERTRAAGVVNFDR